MSENFIEKLRAYYRLIDYRDSMLVSIHQIEKILKEDFPDEFHIAYQHWIPQIKTALTDDARWLPRSDYNFDYTLTKIEDKEKENDTNSSIKKFI